MTGESTEGLKQNEATGKAQELQAWNLRLLPLMSRMLVGLTIFFFLATAVQLVYLHREISEPPVGDFAEAAAMLESAGALAGQGLALPAAAIATQTALERNAVARRYHQANVSLMSRVWTRYLGFTTGMVLAMVGAVFILGRLQSRMSEVTAKAADNEFSFKTESPGLILAGLGVLLMITTILTHHEINVEDSAIYAAGWSMQTPQQAEPSKPVPFPTGGEDAEQQEVPASPDLENLLQEMDDEAQQ